MLEKKKLLITDASFDPLFNRTIFRVTTPEKISLKDAGVVNLRGVIRANLCRDCGACSNRNFEIIGGNDNQAGGRVSGTAEPYVGDPFVDPSSLKCQTTTTIYYDPRRT